MYYDQCMSGCSKKHRYDAIPLSLPGRRPGSSQQKHHAVAGNVVADLSSLKYNESCSSSAALQQMFIK